VSAVDYTLTTEQQLLRDSLASYLNANCSGAQRANAARWTPVLAKANWRALAEELGILGATLPEKFGGLGGGRLESMIIMEELGKAMAAEPFLETAVLCGRVLADSASPAAARVITEIIAGEAIVAIAHSEPDSRYNLTSVRTAARRIDGGFRIDGRKSVVVYAPCARYLIISARTHGEVRAKEGIALFLADPNHPQIRRRDYLTLDGRGASEIELEGVFIPDTHVLGNAGAGMDLLAPAMSDAVVALCAEGVGCMRAMLAATIDFSKQRQQFGKSLASFQVLRHAMVDMFAATELAAAITHRAALSGQTSADHAQIVSAAKVQVAKSARLVGQNAVQIHGAIGTTQELALGGYFKRSMIIESQFGSADHHSSRYSALARKV
jgi:alkylation response protein AidB-like acyl-CoA dehydrogenase